jgi:hypothetical protein
MGPHNSEIFMTVIGSTLYSPPRLANKDAYRANPASPEDTGSSQLHRDKRSGSSFLTPDSRASSGANLQGKLFAVAKYDPSEKPSGGEINFAGPVDVSRLTASKQKVELLYTEITWAEPSAAEEDDR